MLEVYTEEFTNAYLVYMFFFSFAFLVYNNYLVYMLFTLICFQLAHLEITVSQFMKSLFAVQCLPMEGIRHDI
jgi:hypothetical protein